MNILSEEERLCLINSKILSSREMDKFFYFKWIDLKDRYHQVFAEYQRLPLRIESSSSKIKEASLTRELVELEHEINFLEKNQQIFIVQMKNEQ